MKKALRKVAPFVAFAVLVAGILVGGVFAYQKITEPAPPPKYTELTKDNVKTELGAKSGLVVIEVCVTERYACEVQMKEIDKFHGMAGDQVKIVTINAETQPELAAALGIESPLDVPATFLAYNGQIVGGVPGVFSAEELGALLQQMLQQPAGTNGGTTTQPSTTNPGGASTQPSTTPAPSGN